MALSNAERQARHRQRIKSALTARWIRKDFDDRDSALETIKAFHSFFAQVPQPNGLRVFSRTYGHEGMSLLVCLPWPLTNEGGLLPGWREAEESAEDLGHWHKAY